jgi:phosphatidylglycerol lysyltransferase
MDLKTDALNDEPELAQAALPPPLWRGWLARIAGLLWVAVGAWAVYGLHREWSGFHLTDLRAALARIGPVHLVLALALTFVSYSTNALIGLMGQHWSGYPIVHRWRDLAVALITSAFTMNAGGSVVGGGSIRLRFAAAHSIRVAAVGKITLFSGLVGWAGHALVCGVLLIFTPPPLDWLQPRWAGGVGAVLVLASVAMLFGSLVFPGKWPGRRLCLLALIISAIDWIAAALAMWVLFPGSLPLGVGAFVAIVASAQAIAALTHVPGGVGVLEFTITKALSGAIAAPMLAGVLVIYRLLYYFIPFAVGIALLGVRELRLRRKSLQRGSTAIRKGWGIVAPRLAALLALAGGFMLLLSAYTPIEEARRGWVMDTLPLPFIEASNFISSLTGAVLIILARGLQRRIQAAWWLAILLMVAGIIFSLVKGFDWEEALVLGFIIACLLPYRSYFHRTAALWTYRFTVGWWAILLTLIAVAVWLGFFHLRHIPYEHELWWQFTFESDASRFLRAAVGASTVFVMIALAQVLRPSKHVHAIATDPAQIQSLVRHSGHADAALAYLDDKSFTLSADASCGLMHADQGRSRIVMSDPLGDAEAADELLWKFVEQAQSEGMRPVFYQISISEMPRLVDMGFKLYKLGEEARVPLATFTLDGANARRLRQASNRFHQAGLKFAIWEPAQVIAEMATLRAVSAAWLAEHHAGEKGFSLGCFDPEYLKHFRCAVVADPAGQIIAFCNILATENKAELSIDLMRHLPTAPNGVMDAMFIELMLWGQAEGYQQFNLGMAPLSGLSTHSLAPLWNKLAYRIFHRGETFYHFRGLRGYKDKFKPEWESRYIAVQSAWSLPSALLDATALIGGGLRATLSRKGGDAK